MDSHNCIPGLSNDLLTVYGVWKILLSCAESGSPAPGVPNNARNEST